MIEHSRLPELLAPAGSPEALAAALANGADAVYLGVDRLNARRGAANFTLDTLSDATRRVHLAGGRAYLTANVVVLPSEMDEALTLVDEAWAAGVDAVIVQDLGLLGTIASQLPHVRVHASTQIDAHNTPTIQTLAELGVSRVTLAREVSLSEIARLVRVGAECGVEVEAFGHGALCVCYSGQCLLSSMIGGRSANRGMCAQPCRLPYELDGPAGAVDTPGAHLLSPKDLASIDVLPQLVEAGVASIKIEGRMKSPEYVALVTGTYRAALDRAIENADTYQVRDGEHEVLAEAFSRGFSTAYLTDERGNEMMSYRRPNNRGVAVGRVARVEDDRATLVLDRALDAEDTLEFWTGAGRVTQRAGTLVVDGRPQGSAAAGQRVTIALEGTVGRGDRVFRVANAALLGAARRTFAASDEGAAQPLDVVARVVIGEPMSLAVRDARGRMGSATGPNAEPARTKAVTADEVLEHVGRLGGTPYRVGAFDLALSPGVGVGFAQLHRLRRDAIADYEAGLLAEWDGREATGAAPRPLTRSKRGRSAEVRLVAACPTPTIAQVALDAGADEATVPTYSLAGSPSDGMTPQVARVVHDREIDAVERVVRAAGAATVGNLGLLAPSARDAVARADWGLNVTNPWTADVLARLGASSAWASPELNGAQLADVVRRAPLPIGTSVWGRQELMVTEHCILMAEGPCSRACGLCERRGAPRYLKDRKGYEFPVVTDVTGRSHLYNSVSLDLARSFGDVLDTGVALVRLDFSVETPGVVAEQVARWRRLLDTELAGRESAVASDPGTTSGHFYRGVR